MKGNARFIGALLALVFLSAPVASLARGSTWLQIERVNFDLETVVKVECAEFDARFSSAVERIDVVNEDDVGRFARAVVDLVPENGRTPDVRAKVLVHHENGSVDAICMDNNRISLNGVVMRPNRKLIEFVRRIMPSSTK